MNTKAFLIALEKTEDPSSKEALNRMYLLARGVEAIDYMLGEVSMAFKVKNGEKVPPYTKPGRGELGGRANEMIAETVAQNERFARAASPIAILSPLRVALSEHLKGTSMDSLLSDDQRKLYEMKVDLIACLIDHLNAFLKLTLAK